MFFRHIVYGNITFSRDVTLVIPIFFDIMLIQCFVEMYHSSTMFLNIYKDSTMFLNVILPCLLVFVLDMYHFNNVFRHIVYHITMILVRYHGNTLFLVFVDTVSQ